jgi:hypothetical protein
VSEYPIDITEIEALLSKRKESASASDGWNHAASQIDIDSWFHQHGETTIGLLRFLIDERELALESEVVPEPEVAVAVDPAAEGEAVVTFIPHPTEPGAIVNTTPIRVKGIRGARVDHVIMDEIADFVESKKFAAPSRAETIQFEFESGAMNSEFLKALLGVEVGVKPGDRD